MAGPKKQFQRSEVLAKARQRLKLETLPGSQDRAGLLALTQLLYPDLDINDPRYVIWQYDKNPSGTAYDRLGRVDRTIVGQYATIPMRYKLTSGITKGSLSVNTMTHPAYRGQGLFMLLAEEVFQVCQADGAKLTLGFPNPNSYKGFLKHLDFKDMGSLPLWVLPLNLEALAHSETAQKTRILPPLMKLAAPFWHAVQSARGLNKKTASVIESALVIDDAFTGFWESVKAGYKNLVVRDQRYLSWRFMNHPTRQYTVSTASAGEKMLGYIVTRKTAVQGVSCGMIVDLLVAATLEGQSVAEDLIRTVSRDFREAGLGLAGCLAPRNSIAAAALARCGYFRCPDRFLPQPFPVILRWNVPEPAPGDIFDVANWYLTMGDYDAV